MADISIPINVNSPSIPNQPVAPDYSAPESLRRLHLTGTLSEPWRDIISLDSSDLETVARKLDTERDHLQTDFGRGATAVAAIVKVEDLLKQADELAASNEKFTGSTEERKQNQKDIDALMSEADKTLASAGTVDDRLFNGSATLTAGPGQSIQIDPLSLKRLGRISNHGHSVNLSDIASHHAMDTSTRRANATAARRSIKNALDSLEDVHKQIEDFQSKVIRPRLGDIANTLDGLYSATAPNLTTTTDAMKTANDIRTMLLTGATIAAAIGADGWDKDRVLALVTPVASTG